VSVDDGTVSDLPRIRVAAILARGHSVVLVRHQRDDDTYWLLPGGGVDHGEALDDALIREVQEETTLTIRPRRLVLVNDSIPPDRRRHILNLTFTADIVGGELRRGSDARVAEARFVPVDDLANLVLYPDIREHLMRGLREGFGEGPAYLGNLWK
jgi:ADP-ribose pyrophosphatase YjhB (NUDIX family)